jgi:hypothetical protein
MYLAILKLSNESELSILKHGDRVVTMTTKFDSLLTDDKY